MTPKPDVDTWITRSAPNSKAQMRLFCFPYAGGGSVVFHHWPRSLPADVEVCAIKLPGRENRLSEAPFTHIRPLTDALVTGLRPYLDRPFAFFGHSLGGLVGYEVACGFREQHLPIPLHLFVSASRAPHLPASGPPTRKMSTPVFMQRLRELNGTPEQILNNDAMMELFLPTIRADFELSETYVATQQGPLSCPISAFGGRDDLITRSSSLQAWRDYTQGDFTLQLFSGGHFFLHSGREALLNAVHQVLEGYLTPHSPQTESKIAS